MWASSQSEDHGYFGSFCGFRLEMLSQAYVHLFDHSKEAKSGEQISHLTLATVPASLGSVVQAASIILKGLWSSGKPNSLFPSRLESVLKEKKS